MGALCLFLQEGLKGEQLTRHTTDGKAVALMARTLRDHARTIRGEDLRDRGRGVGGSRPPIAARALIGDLAIRPVVVAGADEVKRGGEELGGGGGVVIL